MRNKTICVKTGHTISVISRAIGGAAIQAPKWETPPPPIVALQEDSSGNVNEVIVLLEYGQTERLRALLGRAGKEEAVASPTGLERAVLAALTNKSSPALTTAFQAFRLVVPKFLTPPQVLLGHGGTMTRLMVHQQLQRMELLARQRVLFQV